MTDHLDLLESHAIFILREVVAECERPVLLFSGGKDSAVLLHLAIKAFAPQNLPFPVLHIDTGQNFPEVIAVSYTHLTYGHGVHFDHDPFACTDERSLFAP